MLVMQKQKRNPVLERLHVGMKMHIKGVVFHCLVASCWFYLANLTLLRSGIPRRISDHLRRTPDLTTLA
jgi:hypothetical protein